MCEKCPHLKPNPYDSSLTKELKKILLPYFDPIHQKYDEILYRIGDFINAHPEVNEYDLKGLISVIWDNSLIASGIEIALRGTAYAHTKCKKEGSFNE